MPPPTLADLPAHLVLARVAPFCQRGLAVLAGCSREMRRRYGRERGEALTAAAAELLPSCVTRRWQHVTFWTQVRIAEISDCLWQALRSTTAEPKPMEPWIEANLARYDMDIRSLDAKRFRMTLRQEQITEHHRCELCSQGRGWQRLLGRYTQPCTRVAGMTILPCCIPATIEALAFLYSKDADARAAHLEQGERTPALVVVFEM